MTLTNTEKNLSKRTQIAPNWLPIEFENQYNKTDLSFEFCLKLFAQLEAAKREKFPSETIRQWFIEFIKRGWTKKMVQDRYDALLSTKIYGIEKLDFSDWVNSVQVYAIDEVNNMVKNRVDSMIAKGRFLKDKKIELTDEEKTAVDLAVAKEIELGYQSGWYEARETYQQERKKRILHQ